MDAPEPKSRVRVHFERLKATEEAELPALTLARARRFLKEYPDHGPAWLVFADALAGFARFKAARRAIRKSIELCPDEKRWIPISRMGHHFRDRGLYRRAARWFRKTIEAAPGEASGYIYLGAALARLGKLTEAEAAHRAATNGEAGCIDEAYLNLGFVLRAQHRLVEASECFRKAIELTPDFEEAKQALLDVRKTIAYVSRHRRRGR